MERISSISTLRHRLRLLSRISTTQATRSSCRASISSSSSSILSSRRCYSSQFHTRALTCHAATTITIPVHIHIHIPSRIAVAQRRNYGGREAAESTAQQGTIDKGKGKGVVDDEVDAVRRPALEAPGHLNEKERKVWELLVESLQPVNLEVQDISGGCGSMYGIDIVSERFRGLSMLKQQRLVNQVLGEEIKGWHGVQLKTRAP